MDRNRPKRLTNVLGNAVRMAQIATGEAEKNYEGKQPAE
jgi:hypothetical protein